MAVVLHELFERLDENYRGWHSRDSCTATNLQRFWWPEGFSTTLVRSPNLQWLWSPLDMSSRDVNMQELWSSYHHMTQRRFNYRNSVDFGKFSLMGKLNMEYTVQYL